MGLSCVELADGFSCYLSGLEEARLVYKEIFKDHCYDIAELPEDAFIVDAGANIGLFSIYMKQKYPSSKIIAFEPAPENFEALGRNLEMHKTNGVEVHQCGLGPKTGEAALTYYPLSPANSTFYPQGKELQKEFCTEVLGQEVTDAYFENKMEVTVPIERLSHFLDQSAVTKIDLFKIDVEGAELDVIGGVDDKHWPMVQNIVLEACNTAGEADKIQALLKSKGFEITVKENPVDSTNERFAELTLYIITGRRFRPQA
jgi:FkbM family methyltransferase